MTSPEHQRVAEKRKLFERIHLGTPQACMDFVSQGGFDLVSSIDSEEIFPAFEGGRDAERDGKPGP